MIDTSPERALVELAPTQHQIRMTDMGGPCEFRGRRYYDITDDDEDGTIHFLFAEKSFWRGRKGLIARYVVYPEGVIGLGKDWPCRCRVVGTACEVIPVEDEPR